MSGASARRIALLAAGGAVAIMGVFALLLVLPSGNYIFLPDRAHPVAPLVSVKGGHDPKGPGGIYFVDVFVRKASLLEKLLPVVRADGARVHPASDVAAPGVSDAARRQADLRDMTRSQQIAAAVALRALGRKVVATPIGALIEAVDPMAPAAGKLEPGDIVVSVNERRVRTPRDLQSIGAFKPGTRVTLGVRRGSEQRSVTLVLAPNPVGPRRSRIGVAVGQAANIQLSVSVRINAGSVGGPSAGVAFALDVMEELGRDVDHGYKVAATGELDLNGNVLPIGGVEQKALGARRAHVDVFIVPAGENTTVARRYADGMKIVPVRNFQQALQALATLPPKA
ncbi:MAG: S16 family serine protease [Thermoleophilia bacterium]